MHWCITWIGQRWYHGCGGRLGQYVLIGLVGGLHQLLWVKGSRLGCMAERMNIQADQVATSFLVGPITSPGMISATPKLTVLEEAKCTAVGGRWATNPPHNDVWTEVWDDFGEGALAHARACAFEVYWRTRMKERLKKRAIIQQLADARPVPDNDRRLRGSRHGLKGGDEGFDVFISKLWWDHLPSQQVLSRGDPLVDPSSSKCELCQVPGEGSTWHVMSACQGAEEFGLARISATTSIHSEFDTLCRDIRGGCNLTLLQK
jgi:hypothetical protein